MGKFLLSAASLVADWVCVLFLGAILSSLFKIEFGIALISTTIYYMLLFMLITLRQIRDKP